MKKLFPSLIIILSISLASTHAQNLFTENFEIPDSVVSSGAPGWSLTNSVQTSGFFADSSSASVGDTSALTSIAFSTLGSYTVKLNFNHLITSDLRNGIVSISTDNGTTWITLGANEYLGNGNLFSLVGYFSSQDYFAWQSSTGCPIPPFDPPINNNQFMHETFDISALCANQATVLIRFEDINSGLNCGAWYIDDILITGSPIFINSTNSCSNNGAATVTPFFGTAPHTYFWSTGQTTPNINNLSAGTYTVTVTESGGNSVTDSVIIQAPFDIFMNITPASCPPGNNGSAAAFAFGGSSPYTYLWSTGDSNQTIGNLANGIYTVIVTDANSCFSISTATIYCGLGINISSTPSSCSTANGTATINSVTNGVSPITYQWNTNPIQTTQTATGLNGNTIANVTITDATGTTGNSFVIIPYVDTINVNTTFTPSQCSIATGAATATASGGLSPYTYSWNTNPPQNTATANNLSAQSYFVIATDNNGCSSLSSVTVSNSNTMTASTFVSSNTQCGLSSGAASINANGGTPPYSYSWNTLPVQTTANASNLSYGNHQVIVSDNNGCSIVRSVFIEKINSMVISVSYPNTSCVCVNPTVNVSGGVSPYTYMWDDGTSNQTANCFNEGYHYVQVTDAAGCTQYKSFYVTFSANCYVTINGTVFADLNKNCLQDAGEYGIANTPVELSKAGFSKTILTNNNGNYSFYEVNDIFQLSHTPSANWYTNCPTTPSAYTISSPSGSIVSLNFADTSDNYFDEAALINCFIFGRARGFNSNNYVTIRNNGTNQLSGTLTTIHDPILTYVNSNPLVTSYNSGSKTANWNYTSLNPGETRNFQLTTLIPAGTVLGTLLNNSSSVTPISTDIVPTNNNCGISAIVNGSYDPNDKISWPNGNILVDSLWHNYFIHFQNTGTATAVRVIIEDTLDANLDLTSISNFIGSHPYTIDDSQLPLIRFIFDNINLPDSNENEPESHGFIAFRIKRNLGTPIGTQITNTAYIYFDFNSAIMTNTVVNSVVYTGINENVSASSVVVYPNPSTAIIYFQYDLTSNEKKELHIFNALNQLILRLPLLNNKGQLNIDLKEQPTGIYTYRIVSSDRLFNSGKISLIK